MIGKLLDGRYQVVQVLSGGGFGETYIAQDTRRPGNPVCVVKHLKPASRDPETLAVARRLFNSEAETLETLGDHPQIPRLLAYFEEDEEFYLVQDYIDGHTLAAELVPGKPWQESWVIQLLLEVLPILEFVHSQGVIHRDVKPENLLRNRQEKKLFLVDFGSVKQVSNQTAIAKGPLNPTVVVGTPGYMPSEQGRGQPRHSSDIYSLGIICLQALSGVKPVNFRYDTKTGEILWQHLADISPELATILNQMVLYHFRERFASAREVLAALQPLIPATPPLDYPPSPELSAPPPPTPKPATPPLSEQRTVAVGGGNSPQQPTPRPSPSPRPTSPPSPEPDNLPVFLFGSAIAAILALGIGIAFALRQEPTTLGEQRSCTVTVSGLNVRSSPGGTVVDVVERGTVLALTGVQENAWVEINDPVSGWVYNSEQYIDCDAVSQPPEVVSPTPSPSPSPSPSPKPQVTPKPKPVDNGPRQLAAATEKYQQGNLEAAIAQANSIGRTSSAYNDAQAAIRNWRSQWSQAEAKYNEALQAFDASQWDDVIAYANSDLPDNRYWREQFQQLAAEAKKRQAEAEKEPPPPQPSPSESPKPPSVEVPEVESPEPPNTEPLELPKTEKPEQPEIIVPEPTSPSSEE
ncbi:serine/threonine protein kinase [Oscillatoria salina]|uniref:serine/threonine protein kinase n=1 Tax=Oscillatoria salina TaxID=331517 RepID=UPI001CCEF107|nr:serine/threonine protein kinase [Oscillatoria salina]MBZ8179443.1 protein kinase [Oscillatoria salina IIICB1]